MNLQSMQSKQKARARQIMIHMIQRASLCVWQILLAWLVVHIYPQNILMNLSKYDLYIYSDEFFITLFRLVLM